MVLDRMFLWMFTAACLVGTFGIIIQAPTLYDMRDPIETDRWGWARDELTKPTEITAFFLLLLLLLRLLLMQTILQLLCSFKQSLSAFAVVIRIRQGRNQKYIGGCFFPSLSSVPLLPLSLSFSRLKVTHKIRLRNLGERCYLSTTFAATRRTFAGL